MENIIKIENLKMRYARDSELVLQDLNFSVNKGEIIGYIGPNGAGKTTTLKIILGMIDSFEGNVEVFGEKISSEKIDYKYKIGYVPEGGELYENLNGAEYIEFLGKIYKLEKELLKKRLDIFAEHFGIKESLNQRISSYSKGMKQKILIIGALIHNPEIIFLDEPLNGLDANSVMILKSVLQKLAKKGKTIFYSSHIMDVVEKISDRIILLKDGEVIANGTFEELQAKSSQGSLENIFNSLTNFNEHEKISDDILEALEV